MHASVEMKQKKKLNCSRPFHLHLHLYLCVMSSELSVLVISLLRNSPSHPSIHPSIYWIGRMGKNSFKFHSKRKRRHSISHVVVRSFIIVTGYIHRRCRCLCIDFFFSRRIDLTVCRISIDFPFEASRFSYSEKKIRQPISSSHINFAQA